MNIIDQKYMHVNYLYQKRCKQEHVLKQYIEKQNDHLKALLLKRNIKYFQICMLELSMMGPTYVNDLWEQWTQVNQTIDELIKLIDKASFLLEKNRMYKEYYRKTIIAWHRTKEETMKQMWQNYKPEQSDLLPFKGLEMDLKEDIQKKIGELKNQYYHKK